MASFDYEENQSFPETRAALEKLMKSLRCRNCGTIASSVYTLGACDHIFCKECCRALSGEPCPVWDCRAPSRAHEARPEKCLSDMAALAHRLQQLLKGQGVPDRDKGDGGESDKEEDTEDLQLEEDRGQSRRALQTGRKRGSKDSPRESCRSELFPDSKKSAGRSDRSKYRKSEFSADSTLDENLEDEDDAELVDESQAENSQPPASLDDETQPPENLLPVIASKKAPFSAMERKSVLHMGRGVKDVSVKKKDPTPPASPVSHKKQKTSHSADSSVSVAFGRNDNEVESSSSPATSKKKQKAGSRTSETSDSVSTSTEIPPTSSTPTSQKSTRSLRSTSSVQTPEAERSFETPVSRRSSRSQSSATDIANARKRLSVRENSEKKTKVSLEPQDKADTPRKPGSRSKKRPLEKDADSEMGLKDGEKESPKLKHSTVQESASKRRGQAKRSESGNASPVEDKLPAYKENGPFHTPSPSPSSNRRRSAQTPSGRKPAEVSTPTGRKPLQSRKVNSSGGGVRRPLEEKSPSLRGTPNTSLEKKNMKGETPLHVAVISNKVERVKALLQAGATPNTKDNAGWTPLHEAVHYGFVEVARALLEAGACVNFAAGEEEEYPLHDAIQANQVDCVRLLVSYSASLDAKNGSGKTPQDLAVTEEMRAALQTPVVVKAYAPTLEEQDRRPVCLLGSQLPRDQKELLQEAAAILHGTVAKEFSPKVTHLVIRLNEKGLCECTAKFLHAVLAGCWIVSAEWLTTCQEHKQHVQESAFEVQGNSVSQDSLAAQQGRICRLQQHPSLFSGCQFFFRGDFFADQKQELQSLVKEGGGKLLTREPRLDSLEDYEPTKPFHADKDHPLKDCSIFIVVADASKVTPLRSERVSIVTADWIKDCIATFSLLKPPQ